MEKSPVYFRFFREFLSRPGQTGAVAPSSKALARKMIEWFDLEHAAAVVEYGAGTGVFTEFILAHLSNDCRFIAIELNPHLAEIFRRNHPNVSLYVDTVKNVRAVCDRGGIEEVDCVISGLPWACFSDEVQGEFLDALMTILRPGGQFGTFAYLQGLLLPRGRCFRKRLGKYFSEVSRSSIVWRNLPPAFVYRCRR